MHQASYSPNPESLEALAFGDKDRLRVLVCEHVRRCRERGATADEICQALSLGHNSCAPRLTELESSGLIVTLPDENGKLVRRKLGKGVTWVS